MNDISLQYPVGRFTAPLTVTSAMTVAAIDAIAAAPVAMRAAVSGLSASQLATPYRDGGWTLREVVHHVADSHMHAYIRVKFALTEDSPTIRPYDEAAWSLLPDVVSVPIETSLGLIEGIHQRWVACLRGLDAGVLTRPFVHPELGPQSIALSLLRYDWHGRHHIAHITALRSRMSW
jgi:DinB superfamily